MFDNFYKNIDLSDKYTLFKYIVIFIILIWISSFISIGLNVILMLIIGVLIVFYMDYTKQDELKENKKIMDNKFDNIRPYSEIIGKYDDIINFLFSIQDMYIYNPPAYEEIVDNIDEFLKIYEESKMFNEKSGTNYVVADAKKTHAINSLHSLIYNLPSNKFYMDKLDRSINTLDKLLTNYLNDIYNMNKSYTKSYGYTNRSVIINKGPKEINYYGDEPFVFDIF
jgi:hypothetical protein